MPSLRMETTGKPGDVVNFGPFTADLRACVLRKHGVKVRLQSQPFQVLAALLEQPGTLVTREDLQRRLWPGDTFVDFEHGLNAAVTRLRQALGDSAEEPRYIERLAKRGYRFIGTVPLPVVEETPNVVSTTDPETRRRTPRWLVAGVIVTASCALTFYSASRSPTVDPIRPLPLTAFRGMEVNPALSPDGKSVAFAWNGENQDNFDIYVMPIA